MVSYKTIIRWHHPSTLEDDINGKSVFDIPLRCIFLSVTARPVIEFKVILKEQHPFFDCSSLKQIIERIIMKLKVKYRCHVFLVQQICEVKGGKDVKRSFPHCLNPGAVEKF